VPIIRANPQGIIQSVSVVPISGADGVIRSATSSWLQDRTGIMRPVYGGATPPSSRTYIYRTGVWSDTLLTTHIYNGDHLESDTYIEINADSSAALMTQSTLTLSAGTSDETSGIFMSYTRLGVDIDCNINKIGGGAVKISLLDSKGMFSIGKTLIESFDSVTVVDMSNIMADDCAKGLQFNVMSMSEAVTTVKIRAIWLS